MSMNREIWSGVQRQRARTAFMTTLKSADAERAERLAGLRALAELLSAVPAMNATLEDVRKQICHMEDAP